MNLEKAKRTTAQERAKLKRQEALKKAEPNWKWGAKMVGMSEPDLRAMVVWEYARHSEDVKKLVKSVAATIRDVTKDDPGMHALSLCDHGVLYLTTREAPEVSSKDAYQEFARLADRVGWCELSALLEPEFPDHPWRHKRSVFSAPLLAVVTAPPLAVPIAAPPQKKDPPKNEDEEPPNDVPLAERFRHVAVFEVDAPLWDTEWWNFGDFANKLNHMRQTSVQLSEWRTASSNVEIRVAIAPVVASEPPIASAVSLMSALRQPGKLGKRSVGMRGEMHDTETWMFRPFERPQMSWAQDFDHFRVAVAFQPDLGTARDLFNDIILALSITNEDRLRSNGRLAGRKADDLRWMLRELGAFYLRKNGAKLEDLPGKNEAAEKYYGKPDSYEEIVEPPTAWELKGQKWNPCFTKTKHWHAAAGRAATNLNLLFG